MTFQVTAILNIKIHKKYLQKYWIERKKPPILNIKEDAAFH